MKTIQKNWEVKQSLFDLMKVQGRVIVALMLRDLKTRFFGSEFGYIIAVAWPLSHIFILIFVYTAAGRVAPYGESPALWFATGVVPYIAFSYTARFTMLGIVTNKPLLTFPVVKVIDILIARALMEVLNVGLVIAAVILIFWLLDIDFVPLDATEAFFALGACMLLGLGVGIINGIIAAAIPIWVTGFALLLLFLWVTSGVLFVPSQLPETLRYPLSFNPITQGMEWMRSAYYPGYGAGFIDKPYLIAHGLLWACGGFLLERAVRGKLLH